MNDFRIPSSRRIALARVSSIYGLSVTAVEKEETQVARFNTTWGRVRSNLAFYRDWQRRHRLPDSISDLRQLDGFPILTKNDLQERRDLVFAESSPNRHYQTGGSTAEPTRFPRGGSAETDEVFANNYVGRAWWGLAPYEKSVLVWGHSHLYGVGLGRHLRRAKRVVLDSMGRTLRLDGYAHTPELIAAQLDRLIRYRPRYMVGYSSAVARLARIATERQRGALAQLDMKGIVVTAENLDEHDEALIGDVFSSPIIIEYGAAETGIIAISRETTRNIQILWDTQLITLDSQGEAIITTLSPTRHFPLINYTLGDILEPNEITASGSVLTIRSVTGRTADHLTVKSTSGTTRLGALQLSHILKSHPAVDAVQFTQLDGDRVRVHVKGSVGYSLSDVDAQFRRQLLHEFPMLRADAIEVVDEPDQMRTRAGKHLIMRPAPNEHP